MKYTEYILPIGEEAKDFDEIFIGVIRKNNELIRCKDCKHRPRLRDAGKGEWGCNLDFPDENHKCPGECEDPWYSWMPNDDWFCGNGERKE